MVLLKLMKSIPVSSGGEKHWPHGCLVKKLVDTVEEGRKPVRSGCRMLFRFQVVVGQWKS